jgi:hypothetical protein
MDGGGSAGASPQRFLEVGGPAVLSQEVAKGFVRQLLKVLHLVAAKQVKGLPSLVVELDALAFHQNAPSNFSRMTVAMRDMTIDPRQPSLLEKKTNI